MTQEVQPKKVGEIKLKQDVGGPFAVYKNVILEFWDDGTVTWRSRAITPDVNLWEADSYIGDPRPEGLPEAVVEPDLDPLPWWSEQHQSRFGGKHGVLNSRTEIVTMFKFAPREGYEQDRKKYD